MKTLQFEDKNIRVSEDENKQPIFVAKDVANAIGYIDTINAIKQHVSLENKHYRNVQTIQGKQKMTIINKNGVKQLILSSRLDTYSFKKWLDENVYHIEYVEVEPYIPQKKDFGYILKSFFPNEVEFNINLNGHIVDCYFDNISSVIEYTDLDNKFNNKRHSEVIQGMKIYNYEHGEDVDLNSNKDDHFYNVFYIKKGEEMNELRKLLIFINEIKMTSPAEFMED